MRNNPEEIYNGPKLQGPINLESLAGSSEDEAFAEGRRLYKSGTNIFPVLLIPKDQNNGWLLVELKAIP